MQRRELEVDLPGVTVESDVLVRMRDGTELVTDIYRPDDLAHRPPAPALVHRTPYGKSNRALMTLMIAPEIPAARGYVVLVQDTRGRFSSRGDGTPFRFEASDGYDTIEWAARQPWCDGNVGIYGSSGMGVAAFQAAAAGPPHLKAAFAYIAGPNPGDGFIYANDALQLGFVLHWALSLSRDVIDHLDLSDAERIDFRTKIASALEHRWETIKHLPLTDMPGLRGPQAAFWREWLEHPPHDPFWEAVDATRPGAIRAPMLHIGGWYDLLLRGHIDLQRVLQSDAAGRDAGHRFIAGPWDHGAYMTSQTTAGQRDFGLLAPSGAPMVAGLFFSWFDKWLKGGDGAGIPEARVRYFMMGLDEWRETDAWPPPGEVRSLFFGGARANTRLGGGTLTWNQPKDEGLDTFTYDPRDPVPSVGGRTLQPEWLASGVQDQREVELRPDVLVYTSAPLESEVEIAGPIRVVLHASTSAEDTDFTGKLVDVEPEGYCANIAEGLARARYRDGHGAQSWAVPDRFESYGIDLGDVAHTFRAGHCIRVEVSSSNFPHYDRNLNSRVRPEQGTPEDMRIARQRVAHGGDQASRVLLPVLRMGGR